MIIYDFPSKRSDLTELRKLLVSHQIRIPKFRLRELTELSRWLDTSHELSWAECRTINRDGETWSAFPTWLLPWNSPAIPKHRSK